MKHFAGILGFLITCSTAFSHVGLDYPTGGENFHPGQTVTIQWHIIVQHNTENWDLYFSDDGGSTWQEIQLDIGVARLTYDWTVPDNITDQGRIKVVMDNAGGNYEDESGDFSITQSAGVAKNYVEIPVEVFPNPTNNFIRIKSKVQTNFDEIHLLASDGTLLETITPDIDLYGENGQQISIRDYAPGVYYLNASAEGKWVSEKIIKR